MVTSFIFGTGQAFAEAIMLIALIFALFKITKLPWEMYHEYQAPLGGTRPSQDVTFRTMVKTQQMMLFLSVVMPILAGYALYLFQTNYSYYSVLLSNYNIFLFVLAGLIPPFQELRKVLRLRADQLHQQMKFPPEELEVISDRIDKLEDQLSDLATLEELSNIQEVLKPALSRVMELVKEEKQKTEEFKLATGKRMAELESLLYEVLQSKGAIERVDTNSGSALKIHPQAPSSHSHAPFSFFSFFSSSSSSSSSSSPSPGSTSTSFSLFPSFLFSKSPSSPPSPSLPHPKPRRSIFKKIFMIPIDIAISIINPLLSLIFNRPHPNTKNIGAKYEKYEKFQRALQVDDSASIINGNGGGSDNDSYDSEGYLSYENSWALNSSNYHRNQNGKNRKSRITKGSDD